MKKRIFIISIIMVLCLGLTGFYIYNNFYKIDLSQFHYSFLSRIVASPDGKYQVFISLEKTTEDSEVTYARGYLEAVSQPPQLPKLIFWQKQNSKDIKNNWIDVKWLDNETVIIDNIKLNVFKDVYDYRRK